MLLLSTFANVTVNNIIVGFGVVTTAAAAAAVITTITTAD